MAAVAMMFYHDIDKSQHPIGFYEAIKSKYGDLDEESTYKKWAKYVFDNTMILDSVKWHAFTKEPGCDRTSIRSCLSFASAFVKNYSLKYASFLLISTTE